MEYREGEREGVEQGEGRVVTVRGGEEENKEEKRKEKKRKRKEKKGEGRETERGRRKISCISKCFNCGNLG
jgi:hypothetical protein